MTSRFKPLKSYLHIHTEFATIRAQMQQNQRLLELIKKELPAPLNDHCLSAVNKNGELILHADSSAWASKIRYFSQELARLLRNKQIDIKKISIKVLIDSHKLNHKKSSRPAQKISEKNSRMMAQVAEYTDDPDLQAALRRLSMHTQD